jgi:L-asparaginase
MAGGRSPQAQSISQLSCNRRSRRAKFHHIAGGTNAVGRQFTRDLGLLGYIDPDKIEYYRTPHRRHTAKSEFSLEGMQSLPYVDVLYIHTGTRPGLANALIALGAKGIVVASVGAGSPGNLDKEIGEILKNGSAVVVQSSRVGEGRIVRNNNWYEPGMVVADNLSPQKAAILLSLALSKTSDPQQIQRLFDEY